MNKKQIAAVFEEMAVFLELTGANPFRVRAYVNGARTIETLAADLELLVRENRLTTVKGIGKDLAAKTAELLETGRLQAHEDLRATVPPGLLEMIRIPNFGPKRVKQVHDKLGIDSIESLEAACQAGRVAELAGFGEKSQQKILDGIAQLRRFSGRHHYHRAAAVAEAILEDLRAMPEVLRCSIAGSLRRRRETIGDLDFLVSAKPGDASRIMDAFIHSPGVEQVIAHGETKSSVILEGGIQADLRVVKDAEYAFALSYFTGSKEHNIALRARALQLKQWSLNEYGFSPVQDKDRPAKDHGSVVACRTEEDIYRALDLDYVPPELREDMGELAAAEAGTLPRLVELENLRGTFHNHSTWSDGAETIETMAAAARDLGLEYLGIADHSKSERQANGLNEKRVRQQGREIERLNRQFKKEGFRIFFGTECDILADGTLDFDDETLALFDYVVASVHSGFGMDRDTMTARICRALAHPAVTMLGHATGRLLLRRDPYEVDMDAVIETAAQHGKIIEINSHPYRLDMDWRLWQQARSLGVQCSINPDAHSVEDLQSLAIGIGVARKGWLRKQDVVNCLTVKQVERLFQRGK